MCIFQSICVYNLSDEDVCREHHHKDYKNCPHYIKVVREYEKRIREQQDIDRRYKDATTR